MEKVTFVGREAFQAQWLYKEAAAAAKNSGRSNLSIPQKEYLPACPVLTGERLLALIRGTSDVIYSMSPDWKILIKLDGKGFIADTAEPERNWLDKYILLRDQYFITGVIYECIRKKEMFDLEHRIIQEDGSIGWTHSRAIPLFDDNGTIREWFGAASNITARKTAEKTLRESEEKYRYLFDEIDLGFGIVELYFDNQGRPVDCNFIEVNKSFERQTGLKDAAGRSMRKMAPQAQQWLDVYERIIMTGKPSRFQEYYKTLGRYFDIYAYPVGEPQEHRLAVLFKDITLQRETERALLESENRYRTIFETAGEGIVYASLDGTCQVVNRRFANMLGYREDEVRGKKYMDFCFPEGRPRVLQNCSTLMRGELLQGEARYRHKDGSEVWTTFNATPVFDAGGAHTANLVICKNITARKKVETELQKSEEKYRNLFEISNDGFWWTDSEGVITDTNKGLASMLGYQLNELVGRNWTDFVDSAFMDKGYQVCEEQRAGKKSLHEFKMKKKCGASIWVRGTGLPLHDEKGCLTGNLSTFTDITKKKQAEIELRRNEEMKTYLLKLSDILQSLSDAQSIQDAATDLLVKQIQVSRSNFTEYNDGSAVIKSERRSKDSPITVPLFRGGKLVASLSAYQSVPRLWTPEEVEMVRETAERTWIAVERARAEEALRQSEEKYRDLVRCAPVGICEYDPRVNRFISVNDAMCEQTGYSREELESINPFKLFDAAEKKQLVNIIVKWINGGKLTSAADYQIITKDGRKLYFTFKFSLKKDMAGVPVRLTIIGHDMTERKKMEEALRKSKKKLHEADKSKNNFISMLSHELRNPLAVITAGISLLQMSGDNGLAENVKETIKRQSNQLCKLVDDLLDLTRITENRIELRKENINLRDLALNVAQDRAIAFTEKRICFTTEIQEEPLFVYADPVRITQCMENLLHNALKFTPEGGCVLFTLRQVNGKAMIMVKDSGVGISKELLPNLFKPFTQANISLDRQNNGGLGLGLYIVKGFVEMHGGNISAESEGVDRGALFKIYLPTMIKNTLVQDAEMIAPCDRRFYRILVIEDCKEQAELLCYLLNMLGHKTSVAYNGIEGIARAKKIKPDIILCDIGLPGMDGFEVAKAIKMDEALKGIYLISLTGYVDKSSIKRAHKSGFDRHLAKPVNFEALQELFHSDILSCGN